ncbi:uncharacterized protein LY89DRAFT_752926 [Mollisia scopiformis]|uniref:Uncharacterized protein n=1 Tax=Mollisia scopiformis TaxID=149040 RepID=A0A194X1A6_MOLSC|nr:uncharacterized protein LY89DRAFT_752926 [Mollisia scopiformis]KUJ13754.1 hypothetical protein LY89DRAFT_752926 [Mollisia scopiformis]
MAEAIAAFSLAANIVQFVDFGGRLIHDAWSIYHKGRGSFPELLGVEKTAEDLKLVLAELVSPLKEPGDETDSERSLKELGQQSAFRLAWKEEDMISQQMRLETIKHQLNLHILVSLREQARKSLSQQEQILTQLAAIGQHTQRFECSTRNLTAEGIGSSLLDFLTAKLGQSGKSSWQREIVSAIHEDHTSEATQDVSDFAIPTHRRRVLQSKILALLRYSGMDDREERIVEAYEETFQWIFSDDASGHEKLWSNFKAWLETDEPLYWITGRAGSGKSTLMKYICHEESASNPVDSTNSMNPQEFSKEELEKMLRSTAMIISQDAKLVLFVDGLDEFEGKHDDLIYLFQDLIANKNIKVCVSSRPWVQFEDAFEHQPSLTIDTLTYPDIKHYVSSKFHGNPGFTQLSLREPDFANQLVENVASKACGVFLWVHLVVHSLLSGMNYGDRISDLQRRLDLLPPDLENLYDKILQSLDPFYLEHAAQLFQLIQASREPLPLLLLSFADEDSIEFALKQLFQPLSPDARLLRTDTMRRRLNSRWKGLLEVGKSATEDSRVGEDTVQYLHRTVKDYVESIEVQTKMHEASKSAFDPHLRLCAGNIAHIKTIDHRTNFFSDGTLWTRVQRCLWSASKIQARNKKYIVPLLDELDETGKTLALKFSNDHVTNSEQYLSFIQYEQRYLVNDLLSFGQWVPTHPSLSYYGFRTNFGCNFLSLVVRYGGVEYVDAKVNRGCFVQRSPMTSMQTLSLEDIIGVQSLNERSRELYFRRQSHIWPLLQDAVHFDSRWATEYQDSVPSFEMMECLIGHRADANYLFYDAYGKEWTVWRRLLENLYKGFNGQKLPAPWSSIASAMIKCGMNLQESDIQAPVPGDLGTILGEPYRNRVNSHAFKTEIMLITKSPTKSWQDWMKMKA